MMNIVIVVSGNGSNLQAIIDAIKKEKLAIHIAAVISDQENAYALTRARAANIPTHIISRKTFSNKKDFENALLKTVQALHPDWIVLAGFMKILNKTFVESFPNRILNIHPALLPQYPGLHTHERVIENGDTEHGSTVHIVTPDLDAGPIICQGKITVHPNDTVDTLKQRVQTIEHHIYPAVLRWISENRLQINHQQEIYLDKKCLPSNGKAFIFNRF